MLTKYLIGFSCLITTLIFLSCKEESIDFCEGEEICEVQVYPNPFTDSLTVEFNAELSQEIEIEIYNINGSSEYYKSFTSSKGKNSLSLQMYSLTSGVYILALESPEAVVTKRVLKN